MFWICEYTSKTRKRIIPIRGEYNESVPLCRYLNTSLIEADAQPKYVRVTVKQKVFQLALNEEIRMDAATSKRSQTTGHLLVTMPKLLIDRANPSALSEDNVGTKEPSEYCKSAQSATINNYTNAS